VFEGIPCPHLCAASAICVISGADLSRRTQDPWQTRCPRYHSAPSCVAPRCLRANMHTHTKKPTCRC